jgi:hypothetical protein
VAGLYFCKKAVIAVEMVTIKLEHS